MNRAERRMMEPIVERFTQDLEAKRFKFRYDPAADMLTLVIYRPESPVTFHDEQEGAYVDFDPDQRRFSALTIVRFRKSFAPRHGGGLPYSWKHRIAFRFLLWADRAAAWIGLDLDRYWDDLLSGKELPQVLRDYREELRDDPHRLSGFPGYALQPAG